LDTCFVASRHKSSFDELVKYWERHGASSSNACAHICLSDATSALSSSERDPENVQRSGLFGEVNFGAYYLDGCGGYAPQISAMLTAALLGRDKTTFSGTPERIVVGFSIVGGNRDVVDKETFLVQTLVTLAKEELGMRVNHVLDDPTRYGVDSGLRKVQGSTLTSGFLLETAI
jgi:hypothetical protein